jgi:acyl-coenzyme A thioesterase PaaI-like protein
MPGVALQDQFKGNTCFGCGPTNEKGLQIKSHWDGDETVCTFQPQPHHNAGSERILNGGIIATIIDCHCVWTAVAHAYRRENRAADSHPPIECVTASLNVNYLKPTPIDEPVVLRARVTETKGRKIVVSCTLSSKRRECCRGEVVAVKVPYPLPESG